MGLSVCVRAAEFGESEGRTADPSTALRSGRDDKGEGIASICIGQNRIGLVMARLESCPVTGQDPLEGSAFPLSPAALLTLAVMAEVVPGVDPALVPVVPVKADGVTPDG